MLTTKALVFICSCRQPASADGENFVSYEEDIDGIDPEALEARFEEAVTLDKW